MEWAVVPRRTPPGSPTTIAPEDTSKRSLVAALALAAFPVTGFARDQEALDHCIATWGKSSPFRKGTPANSVIASGVKVFGIGSGSTGNDPVNARPSLILVRPAVNVMGKSSIVLSNPRGWYCFRSNVTVAGKMEIEAHCDARIASAKDSGTVVGAADESNRGVAVFGALRVTRFGCPPEKSR